MKAVGTKSKDGDREHLQEYVLSWDAYCRMMEGFGMDTLSTDVFASKEAPKLHKCARYWHQGDSAWNKHWGAGRRGHLYVHGAQQDSERIVNKFIADRAKRVLVLTGLGSGDARGEVLRSKIDSIALTEFVFAPDEEIFMDATGTSLPSPGQAWSTHAYYVDGAECHPTGHEALIRRIQAVCMRVMFEDSNYPKVEVKTLSFDENDGVVHYMKDGMHDRVAAKQAGSRVKSGISWGIWASQKRSGGSLPDLSELQDPRILRYFLICGSYLKPIAFFALNGAFCGWPGRFEAYSLLLESTALRYTTECTRRANI